MFTLKLVIFAALSLICESCDLKSNILMNVTEEIMCNGYVVENHRVETVDGYILNVQRIPHGKNGSLSLSPILLIHGIGCDSSSFVDNGLAFQLAESGFDVWLGNVRGNKYAREHKTLSTVSLEFWNYSMDDIAVKDLPAMLSFILKFTRKDKMFYAGASIGNVLGMMLLSSQPEWNAKIIGFLAILPLTRLQYTTWPTRTFIEPFVYFVKNVGIPDFITSTVCRNMYAPTSWLDAPMFNLFFMYKYLGYDPRTSLSNPHGQLAERHCWSGVSVKTYVHLSQVMSNQIHHYSYGQLGNLVHYGSSIPPAYNFSKITASIALFVGENDATANILDVAVLIKDLPNVYSYYAHPYVMFNHDDMGSGNANMITFVSAIANTSLNMAIHLL